VQSSSHIVTANVPTPRHFYRPRDPVPVAQPTVSEQWRDVLYVNTDLILKKNKQKTCHYMHVVPRENHHIRFWYLRCFGCPGLRGRHYSTANSATRPGSEVYLVLYQMTLSLSVQRSQGRELSKSVLAHRVHRRGCVERISSFVLQMLQSFLFCSQQSASLPAL